MGKQDNTPEVKLGDVFYQNSSGDRILTHVVERLGNKYFYTSLNGRSIDKKFLIENLKYKNKDYSQFDIQLYRTIQEIESINRFNLLVIEVSRFFNFFGAKSLKIEQLEEIFKIIKTD